jgi:methionyl aminopeptidase
MNTFLLDAIKGAQIHKKIGSEIRELIKLNNESNSNNTSNSSSTLSLQTIASNIETKIKDYTQFDPHNPTNRGIAFPVGLSLNNCAAHYTPNSKDPEILLGKSDILKIDYGVHYNGIIIDSAFTISLDQKYDEFIDISRKLTQYAVSLCGPDVILGEMGSDIEEYVKSKEIVIDNKTLTLRTMSDLSGHMIRPYEIHAGVAVPNIKIFYPIRMKTNEFYAIEPFITTGEGKSILKEPNSHFMKNPNFDINLNKKIKFTKSENDLIDFINTNYSTLPFCEKWVSSHNMSPYLDSLVSKKYLNNYPPIYDIKDSIISQFEHTVYIKENGFINLTKNDYY